MVHNSKRFRNEFWGVLVMVAILAPLTLVGGIDNDIRGNTVDNGNLTDRGNYLEFNDRFFNTIVNIEFEKKVGARWLSIFNDFTIDERSNGFKFYTRDTLEGATTVNQYRIKLNSTRPFDFKQGYKLAFVEYGEQRTVRMFSFNDVCKSQAIYDEETEELISGYEPNCITSLSEDRMHYEITFFHTKNLDPTITISSLDFKLTLRNNVTFQTHPSLTLDYYHLDLNETNMLLYYAFDVNDAEPVIAIDLTSNEYDGTVSQDDNTPILGSGIIGNGIKWADLEQIELLPADHDTNALTPGGGTPRTWYFWINMTTETNFALLGYLLDSFGGVPSNLIRYRNTEDAFEIGTNAKDIINYPDGFLHEWHHIAIAYNGSDYFGYLDGVLNNTQTIGFTPGTLLKLCFFSNCGVGGFIGESDEVMVFSEAHTQAQISEVYERTRVRFPNDGLYRLIPLKISQDSTLNMANYSIQNVTVNSSVGYSASLSGVNITDYNLSKVEGLVTELHLDNFTFGNDTSGYGNNATYVGSIDQVTSNTKWNGGIEMVRGQGDQLTVSQNALINMSTDMSICLWIQEDTGVDSGGENIIVQKWDGTLGWKLYNNGGTQWEFETIRPGGGIQAGPATSPDSTVLTHLCVTVSSSSTKIYTNGIETTSAVASTNTPFNTEQNIIIGDDDSNANEFDGKLDEISIWNRTLTQREIQEVMIGDMIFTHQWTARDIFEFLNGDYTSSNHEIRTIDSHVESRTFLNTTDRFYTPYVFTNGTKNYYELWTEPCDPPYFGDWILTTVCILETTSNMTMRDGGMIIKSGGSPVFKSGFHKIIDWS